MDEEKFKSEVLSWNNDKLLDEYLELCSGDDCDGMLTKKGEIQSEIIWNELKKRLIDCNFLKPE